MTTGTTVLVIISANMTNTGWDPSTSFMSFAVSGATTISASDATAVGAVFTYKASNPTYTPIGANSGVFVVSNLNAGSNTFTLNYRSSDASGTATFSNRSISVIKF